MAKTMSIIRYKYKADRDFASVQFEGMSCSLGELKRLVVDRSSRSGTQHPRDDYDLIISNATTHEEYKDNSDMISRNTSVVVARRIRGTFESLTPSSNQRPIVSSDDIVNEYLRPAILQPSQHIPSGTSNASSSSTESKPIPSEMFNQSSNNNSGQEMSEDERIKEAIKTSQSRYLPSHRLTNSYTCHNCKQPGHMKNQCPLLLQASSTSNSTANGPTSSSLTSNDPISKGDSTVSVSLSSRIVTNQSPYQTPYHHHHYPPRNSHHHGNRPHHRGSGYSRPEPLPKKTTGIPRDGLIQIPRHIPGALRDQTGAPVVPRQMAQLIIEKSEKKADALAQRARQFQEKGVLPPAPPSSMLPLKSTDEETPPDDLLCPICKQIYTDAVITPCCHESFCDECIRNALVDSEDHQCPHCQRQHVAIDQINPNLFLRKHVTHWREERQHKSSYPFTSMPTHLSSLPTFDLDAESTSIRTLGELSHRQNSDDLDEYDEAILSTITQQTAPVRTAPIVIKMQLPGRTSSPQSIVATRPAEMTFEDGKTSDTDQTTSNSKDLNRQLSITNHNLPQETLMTINDMFLSTNPSENDKSARQTPPSQVAPVSTILSSPPTTTTTTMSATSSIVPHYYPSSGHIPPHPSQIHHRMIYPQQTPSTTSTGLYPMQPNFYPTAMHVPYPGAHHPVGVPSGVMHHFPGHLPFAAMPPSHHHHHLHPMGLPFVHSNSLNGFHLAHYETGNVAALHQPNAVSTSTLIGGPRPHHHQTPTQPIPTAVATPPLSKDEFYMKQRDLQRIQRSSSGPRTRSSSFSSDTSSDSRGSSFSRRDDRYHHRRPLRSSRSRSNRRTIHHRRIKSPNRRRQQYRSSRSPSKSRRSPNGHRTRPRAPPINDHHSSNSRRRTSPHSYQSTRDRDRDRERRRSPRPPPTVQQSTQRTIVYLHESSSSSSKRPSSRDNDHHRHRTRSHSRNRSRLNDDRKAPSSKTEFPSQSESIVSSSPMIVHFDQPRSTLASKIESVVEENVAVSSKLNSSEKTRTTDDKSSNSEKKRKKHHQKKARRDDRSKGGKRRRSEGDPMKTILIENSTSLVET